MALANLNTIQFYQPLTKASLPRERITKASNADGPTVVGKGRFPKSPGPSDGWSALWGDDPIEVIDMTDSPLREHLSPFRQPAPDLKDPEADPEDTSNELFNIGDLDHSISEDHDDLPTVEELILNIGEMRKSERVGLIGENKERLLEHASKNTSGFTTPKSRRGEEEGGYISRSTDEPTMLDNDHSEGGGSSSNGYASDNSNADGQDGEQDPLNTQPTSVTGSETGSITVHKTSEQSTSNTPPCRDALSSSAGKKMCEINNGGKHTEPGSSKSEDKRDQCASKEVEVNNKEAVEEVEGEQNISNRHEKNAPSLRATKKRSLPAAGEKLPEKRDTKRPRFPSPLSSDEETEETGDESDISSYTPTKPHRTRSPRPTSIHSTGIGGDTSDDNEMEIGRQSKWPQTSRMTVIYEQQSWEGEIVDERDLKQGRGRPRKQYLVRWKPSWVDGGRLTSPELLRNWKETKASKCRRC